MHFHPVWHRLAAARRQVPGLHRLDAGEPPLSRSEEHTSELQSLRHLVCRLLLEKKRYHRALAEASPGSTRPADWVAVGARPRAADPEGCHPRLSVQPQEARRASAIFFFKDAAPTDLYTLPPHGSLPI